MVLNPEILNFSMINMTAMIPFSCQEVYYVEYWLSNSLRWSLCYVALGLLFVLLGDRFEKQLKPLFEYRIVKMSNPRFQELSNTAQKGLIWHERLWAQLLTEPLLVSWYGIKKSVLVSTIGVLIFLAFFYKGSLTQFAFDGFLKK